jgi:uncharacterized repeat protein (TIGR01451 family)
MKRLFFSIFLLAVIGFPTAAFAVDLEVTFQTQETQLFVNDEGIWTVRITNPSLTWSVNFDLTVTLPTGYVVTDTGGGTETAGPPHTITWSALNINRNSYIERTFKAKPNCDASSGGTMQARVSYTDPEPPFNPRTITQNSSAIAILNLEVSFHSGSTSLSVGEVGTWTARLTNNSTRNAPAQTLVATLPANYTVTATGGGTEAPAGTITWSSISVPAGGTANRTFSARPNCAASTGLTIHAYGDCPSNSIDSNPIAVKIPSLSIKKTSGGKAQPQVHLGDTVVWDIEFKNGGTGDILNGVAVTDTLGAGFIYGSINPNHGWPSWNTGAIASGASKIYNLTTTVTSCTNLTNHVTGSWGDGSNTCQSVTASVGAELIKRLPNVALTVTPPSQVTYCGWNTGGNITTIKIDNSTGEGTANNFFLEVLGLPLDYGVKNIVVTTGGAGSVTWDNTNKRFVIGNITGPTGARPVVEFTFQTGPTGSPCNVSPYYWGGAPVTLTFQPVYNDECGFVGRPPTEGPYDFSVDRSSVPYFRASKTGPRSASLGDTGLTYNISAAYYAPAGSANVTVNIVDTYPAPFTVTNAGGGTVDPVNHTITWSNVTLVPNDPWTNTIVMEAPTDPCDADKDYRDSLVIYPQVGSSTDCLGCAVFTYPFGSWQNTYINHPDGPIASSSKTVTYYNSMTTNWGDGPAGWGEVCTNNRYRTCYRFNTGPAAPATWSNTDGMGNNISFGDRCVVGQQFVSVDSVTVNGISYAGWPGTSVCDANTNNNNLDLGYLDGAGAPKPNTGAELCVYFTLHSVEASETTNDVDFSGLTIPGYPSGCGGDDDYDQGVVINFTRSYVAVNTSASPKVIDACEAKQFTIAIEDHFNYWPDYWPLYDAQIKLDTKGNYTLLGGAGDPTYPITFTNIFAIDGTAIPAFNPTQAGNVYTWDFGDIRHHQANGTAYSPSPRIQFWMRKNCDATQKDWTADIYFNDRCNDGTTPPVYDTDPGTPAGGGHHYPNEGVTLVKKGNPMANIVPPTVSALSRYPHFTIQGWNAGTGGLYNLNVTIDNNNQLLYYRSATSGTPPDSSPPNGWGTAEDPASPFVWNNLVPNGKGNIVITNKLASCTAPHTDVRICWGCGTGCGAVCTPANCSSPPYCGDANICQCQTAGIDYLLPSPAVMVIEHSVNHKTDYCGDNSTFTVKTKNTSAINAYNVKIVEKLPPGLTYTAGTASHIYSCGGGLIGAPVEAITGTVATGLTITWDYTNALPLDAYNDRPMPEACELTVNLDANIANCAGAQTYSSGNKRASAHVEFDQPCNLAGGSLISSSVYNLHTQAAQPMVTIVKEGRNVTKNTGWTQGQVIADSADIIEWRVTLTSNGDYLATDVRLQDAIPTNTTYVAGSTTVNGVLNPWVPNGIGGASNTLSLGDMDVNTSHVVIFRTTVVGCTSDTTNTAQVTWGCMSGCGGTAPPTERSAQDAVSLRTVPVLSITTSDISPAGYFVTDGGKLRVTIRNYGARATLLGTDRLTVPLPRGFNYDPSCAPTISSNQTHGTLNANPSTVINSTCGGANGNLQWDGTRIDYIDTGETITLEFNLQADGCYLDTTCAGHGPDTGSPPGEEHIVIPSTGIQTSLSYSNSCAGSSSVNANYLTINPRQPDLDISVNPAVPVINPGDTTKLFTFTIRNYGDATAKNIAKVSGGITEPFVSTIGTGFSAPTVMGNTCNGAVTTGAHSITIANMNNLNVGATCTVQIRVNIIPNQSADKYFIDGRIRGTSLRCDGQAVDAASQTCASRSYSDDKVTASAGEGKLVLRPDNTGEGKPCGEVIYLHTIRNNGLVADWFDLTATSSKGWKYVFYRVDSSGNITGTPITSIYLCAKCPTNDPACTCVIPGGGGATASDNASFAVRLFIPCDAPWNTVDNTTITACYRSDPQTCRSVTDITTVITKLFMKKEVRNVTTSGTFSNSATGKPNEVVEYRITFQNYTTTDLSGIIISDPIPPFTTLNTTGGGPYISGGVNYPVWVHFTFNTGTCDCYATPSSPYVTVAIPTGCANPGCTPTPCACNCTQVTTLKPGEKGELYYQVTIKE